MSDKDKYLTISKAAQIKGCSRSTIYHLMQQGKVNTYKFAGKPFIVQDEVFEQVQINRGIPFAGLEERIGLLEKKIGELEGENTKLKERVTSLEGLRETTKRRR